MPSPMGRPTLTDDEAARVRAALRRLLHDRSDNQSELARDMKLSQPSISNILSDRTKPSLDTAKRTAYLLGMSVWELLGSVQLGEVDEVDEHQPERSRAEAAARLLGIDARAITIVRARFATHVDMPARQWLHLFEAAESEIPQ